MAIARCDEHRPNDSEHVGYALPLGYPATAVTCALLLSSLASFALAKIPFRGRHLVSGLVVGVLLVPAQVLLIPVYLLFSRLGLINQVASVILIYTALALPFGTFFLTSSFRGIPNEIIESARLDGASLGTVYRTIILPMGRPAILTLAILSFLSMWNELLLGMMLLPDESKRLLTPTIALLLGRLLTNQPLLMAGLLISSLPTLLVVVCSMCCPITSMIMMSFWVTDVERVCPASRSKRSSPRAS